MFSIYDIIPITMSFEREQGLSLRLRALDRMLERTVSQILSPEDLWNLEKARQFLKRGSLLIIFNHPTVLDPRFIVSLVDRLRRDFTSQSPAAVLAAKKFAEGEMGKLGEIHTQIASAHSVGVMYVEQVSRLKSLKAEELKEARADNLTTLRGAYEFLEISEPGAILFLAPEGTRSINKKMGRGLKDVGKMILGVHRETGGLVECLPVAIEAENFPAEVEQLGLVKQLEVGRWLAGQNLRLHVGELVGVEELEQDVSIYRIYQTGKEKFNLTDAMMLRLGSLLPEDYWGYYGRFLQQG